MSAGATPLWNLAADYVLEKIKNGELDRYGNQPQEGCLVYGAYGDTKVSPEEMRKYIECSRAGKLPEPMDWQLHSHVDTYYGIGSIIGH